MKIYPKDLFPAASELTEAQLLKSFDHPCIPRIYDLDQDTHFYYLYEEFIRGQTLDQFLLQQSHISEQFYHDFTMQLCSTFTYLHQYAPTPVLYRDLKPEHILLCGTRLYLIDFGTSAVAEESENNRDHLGNQTFSSPESFTQNEISRSADIYSIGMLLQYLAEHLDRGPSRPLRAIIHKATMQDPSLRYETVEEMTCELEHAFKQEKHPHLCTTIAVAGSHHGCGATHLAFSLVSVLNYLGLSAVYYEKNSNDSLRNAAEAEPFFDEKQGCLHYHFFRGIPLYGPGITIPQPASLIQVHDYGSEYSLSDLQEYDLVIFVSTGSLWRRAKVPKQLDLFLQKGIPIRIVCNFCSIRQALKTAGLTKARIWRYAPDPDPFYVSHRKIRFFLQLLKK